MKKSIKVNLERLTAWFRSILKKLLENIIIWSQSGVKQLSNVEKIQMNYSSLSPLDLGEKNKFYTDSLLWALQNRNEKQIRNIALTGPYGSGKSSILKTFQNNYKGNEFKFLPISLATFSTDDANVPDGRELLRLIETSIVQQIIYREKDKSVPDSRFKRIKKLSKTKLFFIALGFFIFSVALVDFNVYRFLQRTFPDIALNQDTSNTMHYIEVIVLTVGIMYFIYKATRFIRKVVITKLKVSDVEIGLESNLDKSVLNKHIDEILYFFSVRNYNVLIIEDLDRFNEPEVFTKLRELNLLLNNSKNLKRGDIVFIYAIREDMFNDTERTKFFDFIIPVIPVINSSNSGDILLKKRNEFNYQLTESFINEISYYLQDMRLLLNIINEFSLYKEILGDGLIEDKLFAILTYKNLYPEDFVQLSKNEGELYKLLNSQRNYIKTSIANIDEEILKAKNEIQSLKEIRLKDVSELRRLYLLKIIEKRSGFDSFLIEEVIMSVNDMLLDENFNSLKSGEVEIQFYEKDHYNRVTLKRSSLPNVFKAVEGEVDNKMSYNDREKDISRLIADGIALGRNKLTELETKRTELRHKKLSDLLSGNRTPENHDVDDLTLLLLRKGYIAEDYLNYISLFHGIRKTREDHKFILTVKNQNRLEFDFRIPKPERVIEELTDKEFESLSVLNFDLIDCLLKKSTLYNAKISFLFKQLGDTTNESYKFVSSYIDNGSCIDVFLEKIFMVNPSIWNEFQNDVAYSDEKMEILLKLIFEHTSVLTIKKISKNESFVRKILDDSNFLNITSDSKKLKSVIKELKLKFSHLDLENSPDTMVTYIYHSYWYELNYHMISEIAKMYGEFDKKSFNTMNYSAITNSGADHLLDYIEESINNYLEFYLSIKSNVDEKEDYLIKLINNQNIESELKQRLIETTKAQISDIETINDNAEYNEILLNKSLKPTWPNLYHIFISSLENEESEVSDRILPEALIEYLNDSISMEELSEKKIPKIEDDEGNKIYAKFTKLLLNELAISLKSYKFICSACPWWYSELRFNEKGESRVKLLIENIVVAPNLKAYANIKSSHPELRTLLIEKFPDNFLAITDDFEFTGEDISELLKSEQLDTIKKMKFLDRTESTVIMSNSENLSWIAESIVSGVVHMDSFDNEVLKKATMSIGVIKGSRLKLFPKIYNRFSKEYIQEFLLNMEGEYHIINNKRKKAILSDNTVNRNLLEILVNVNYISSYSTLEKKGVLRVNHFKV